MSVNNGRSLTRSEHRRHDRLLVTRFAMGDAYPSEHDEASTLVANCADCAELAADVKLIASSVSRVPTAPRTRDFMITAEQADKLRGGRVSRWLRSLGTPGWAMLRPVAGVALSIGLVMAVVGAGVPGMQQAGEFATDSNQVNAPAAAASPAAPPEPDSTQPPSDMGPVSAPVSGNGDVNGQEAPEGSPLTATENLNEAYLRPSPEARTAADGDGQVAVPRVDTTRDLLVYGGLAIATLSLALLALALVARRYFADPLLR